MVRGMAGTMLFKRLLKGKVHAEAVEEEDGREAPPYGRDASVGRPGSSPGGVANPGGAGRAHTGTLTKSSMSLGADAVKHPGLKRTLTKKLSTIAPSPTEIATASSNEVGEVVIEVVLATGLQKPSLGPRIGGPPPSPRLRRPPPPPPPRRKAEPEPESAILSGLNPCLTLRQHFLTGRRP